MCKFNQSTQTVKTLEEDLKVFKIVAKVGDKYFGPFQKTYQYCKGLQIEDAFDAFNEIGFHSFFDKELATEVLNALGSRIAKTHLIDPKDLLLLDATIPAGSIVTHDEMRTFTFTNEGRKIYRTYIQSNKLLIHF